MHQKRLSHDNVGTHHDESAGPTMAESKDLASAMDSFTSER